MKTRREKNNYENNFKNYENEKRKNNYENKKRKKQR